MPDFYVWLKGHKDKKELMQGNATPYGAAREYLYLLEEGAAGLPLEEACEDKIFVASKRNPSKVKRFTILAEKTLQFYIKEG